MQGGGRGARGAGAAARLGGELGREEEREQRAPREELGADVVPQRDEAEDDPHVEQLPPVAAERHVEVAHQPRTKSFGIVECRSLLHVRECRVDRSCCTVQVNLRYETAVCL